MCSPFFGSSFPSSLLFNTVHICGTHSIASFTVIIQVCEQCPNVKYEREGYFITVDIEKGMQDGQVSFMPSILNCNVQLPACVAILLFAIVSFVCHYRIALKIIFYMPVSFGLWLLMNSIVICHCFICVPLKNCTKDHIPHACEFWIVMANEFCFWYVFKMENS